MSSCAALKKSHVGRVQVSVKITTSASNSQNVNQAANNISNIKDLTGVMMTNAVFLMVCKSFI